MTLSLNASWIDFFRRSNVQPVVVAILKYGAGASDEAVWVHSPQGRPLAGWPSATMALAGMVPLAWALDPLTNSTHMQTVDIVVQDHPELRTRVAASQIVNKRVRILVGDPAMASGNYVEVFRGVVVGFAAGLTHHTLTLGDTYQIIQENSIRGAWTRTFPGDIALALLQFISASIPVDAASFAPAAFVAANLSHLNVHRSESLFGIQAAREPTPVLALVRELCDLMGTTLTVNAAGSFVLSQPTPGGASVRTLTTDDIGGLAMGALPPVNRVEIQYDWRGDSGPTWFQSAYGFVPFARTDDAVLNEIGAIQDDTRRGWITAGVESALRGSEFRKTLIREDEASQDLYAHHTDAASIRKIYRLATATKWVNGPAFLSTALGDGSAPGLGQAGETFYVYGDPVAGFCGMAGWTRAGGVPADQRLSVARLGYLLIDNEYIAVRAAVPDTAAWTYPDHASTLDSGLDTVPVSYASGDYPQLVLYTIHGRAQLGSTATAHGVYDVDGFIGSVGRLPPGLVFDATIPVLMADRLLDRFSSGCPTVTVAVPLSHHDLELRDIVEIEHAAFLSYGYNGVKDADNLKWEVIGKEEDWLGSPPQIVLTLARAANGFAGTTKYTTVGYDANNYAQTAWLSEAGRLWWRQYINSGLTVSAGAGLTVSIAEGQWGGGRSGMSRRLATATAYTLSASKDTYLYLGQLTGQVMAREVANGAADPGEFQGYLRLAKVVTGGAAVTSVTDQRKLTVQSWRTHQNGGGVKTAAGGGWVQVANIAEAFDHGGQVAAGTFTVPYDGKFEAGGAASILGTANVGTFYKLAIFVNGAVAVELDRYQANASTEDIGLSGWTQLDLTQGQTVSLHVYCDDAAVQADVNGAAYETWFAGRRTY